MCGFKISPSNSNFFFGNFSVAVSGLSLHCILELFLCGAALETS